MKRFAAVALVGSLLLTGCGGATSEMKYKPVPEEMRGAIQHTQPESTSEEVAESTEVSESVDESEAPDEEPEPESPSQEVSSMKMDNRAVLDLYNKGVSKSENWCFSPYSLLDCMSMIAVDVQGTTKAEYEKLGIVNYQFFMDYDKSAPSGLSISNRGYINEALSEGINTEFVRPDCDISVLPFDNEALALINDNVSADTNGKITKLFEALDPDVVSCFVNAVYFNNKWDFDGVEDVYWKGEEKRRVGFEGDVAAGDVTELTPELDMLRLTYPDTDFAMYVICPNYTTEATSDDMDAFMENGFTLDMLTVNDNPAWEEADFKMPSFEFDCTPPVQETLLSMGISDVFSGAADFGGLGDLHIGSIVQKTHVKVNNKGTEAAAATGMMMEFASVAPLVEKKSVRVSQDFVFIIKDESNDTVLFMGRVADPQGKNE